MAYSAKERATIAGLILSGQLTWAAAQKQCGASKSTLSAWVNEARAKLASSQENRTALEAKTEPPRPSAEALDVAEPWEESGMNSAVPGADGPESEKAIKALAALERERDRRARLERLRLPPLPVAPSVEKSDYDLALEATLLEAMNMVRSWARICGDPEFVMANPGGVGELGIKVLDRSDKLVSLIRGKS